MERQQQVSEILRRNCREAIFALIIIVEDSCHTQQRIHERLFQMQAGVVYGHPYNQQAFTGVQVRLCLESIGFHLDFRLEEGSKASSREVLEEHLPSSSQEGGLNPHHMDSSETFSIS